MADAIDDDLYQRTKALLEPGEIDLNGAIVHTDYDGQADVQMMQATLDVGDIIAERSEYDPEDCYVYSGNDDPDFSSNQHQGLTLDDEEFVWECQQLLRDGSFDIVIYYRATADHEAILEDIRELGHEVTGVRGDE
ncbi:hypothetical protein Htur_3249 [Haloterrigena turkmenica DSM 5511]|uniref:Uncharacterized protein n=1 Tax=Haloterrigena turkmenica (strain ATCC 51198 / DSM 5511 / JCM 9101 / NCIMB 13204 / VKM B-1734 / 4k) TaxID=543526 RepID=D2RZS4_HALTV|nr:DUF5778 family protein [Haloterrigena turkmenica]ADB62113.1 hypothetical protein Htur_3249 [Haloterrigena turkmenica DSM 5511]